MTSGDSNLLLNAQAVTALDADGHDPPKTVFRGGLRPSHYNYIRKEVLGGSTPLYPLPVPILWLQCTWRYMKPGHLVLSPSQNMSFGVKFRVGTPNYESGVKILSRDSKLWVRLKIKSIFWVGQLMIRLLSAIRITAANRHLLLLQLLIVINTKSFDGILLWDYVLIILSSCEINLFYAFNDVCFVRSKGRCKMYRAGYL